MTLDEAIDEFNALALEGQELLHEDMDPVEVAVITQLIGLTAAALRNCQQQDSRLKGVAAALYVDLEAEPPVVDQGATEAVKEA